MARFDIYRVEAWPVPLVVDVQADLLSDLASRVVIPLIPVEATMGEAVDRLKPVLTIDKADYVLVTTDISMQPAKLLGKPVGNLGAAYRDEIVAALDFLFQGF